MRLKRRIADWLEHRTGLESAVKSSLYEDIPASAGWHQVFGNTSHARIGTFSSCLKS